VSDYDVFVIGLIAHTCVEATVRFAAELGNKGKVGLLVSFQVATRK